MACPDVFDSLPARSPDPGKLVLFVFFKKNIYFDLVLFVFSVQSQHFTIFSMFCLVFQWISLHFALNYWFPFEKNKENN